MVEDSFRVSESFGKKGGDLYLFAASIKNKTRIKETGRNTTLLIHVFQHPEVQLVAFGLNIYVARALERSMYLLYTDDRDYVCCYVSKKLHLQQLYMNMYGGRE